MPARNAAVRSSSGATSVPWSRNMKAEAAPPTTRIIRVETDRKRSATGIAATAAPSEFLERTCPIAASVRPSSRRYRL
jgi:hypothetical protein